MGLFTTAALALAGIGQSISSGIATNKEAKYNASLMEQQAQQIDIQKGLEGYQYDRAKAQLAGKATARTAKSGFMMTGSPMASMIDSLTQLELDKSIGQYNLEVQKRYALSSADAYRRKGKTAMTQAYSNAFSTALLAGFDMGMQSGVFSGNNYANVGGQKTLVAPNNYYQSRTVKF